MIRTFCWDVTVSCCSRCVMLERLCSNAATTWAYHRMHTSSPSITTSIIVFYIIYYTHMSCSLYHCYMCMLCCCCSWSSNMNSFIGLVFLLLSSVYMCYGLLHYIAQYFVFCLYDSALATIILKATWLDLTWQSPASAPHPLPSPSHTHTCTADKATLLPIIMTVFSDLQQ